MPTAPLPAAGVNHNRRAVNGNSAAKECEDLEPSSSSTTNTTSTSTNTSKSCDDESDLDAEKLAEDTGTDAPRNICMYIYF